MPKLFKDCYIWRYRNKDHSFSKFGPLTIKQISKAVGSKPLKAPRGWQFDVRINYNQNTIDVHQNHYFYMWSTDDQDIRDISHKFLEYIEQHYKNKIEKSKERFENVESDKIKLTWIIQ